MRINLIIPAKGSSQRIKNKNLCVVNGKSLVRLACEKALQCKNVSNVYLDTESEEIEYQVCDLLKEGLKIIKRPREFRLPRLYQAKQSTIASKNFFLISKSMTVFSPLYRCRNTFGMKALRLILIQTRFPIALSLKKCTWKLTACMELRLQR